MSPQRSHSQEDAIAVAIHDVEPANFERCALIRDWLDDHDITRATLLVVPAHDLHPLQDRCGELVDWLAERRRAGDAIAQNGFRGHSVRPARRHQVEGEFARLDGDETRRAVEAGWRILHLAGLDPRGFVAPAYAYTPALHAVLPRRFAWWAGASRLYRAGGSPKGTALTPALALGRDGARRVISPWLVRARAGTAGATLRLDLHPRDLERPRHVAAVEAVLRSARCRRPVTFDELAASESGAAV